MSEPDNEIQIRRKQDPDAPMSSLDLLVRLKWAEFVARLAGRQGTQPVDFKQLYERNAGLDRAMMDKPMNAPKRRWTFSLKRLIAAVALLGVAIACGRALAMLFVGASTAYYGAILVVGMVTTASAGIGVIAGQARLWAALGFLFALPLAAFLAFVFRGADV